MTSEQITILLEQARGGSEEAYLILIGLGYDPDDG